MRYDITTIRPSIINFDINYILVYETELYYDITIEKLEPTQIFCQYQIQNLKFTEKETLICF